MSDRRRIIAADRCLAANNTRDACDAVLRIMDRARVRRANQATATTD